MSALVCTKCGADFKPESGSVPCQACYGDGSDPSFTAVPREHWEERRRRDDAIARHPSLRSGTHKTCEQCQGAGCEACDWTGFVLTAVEALDDLRRQIELPLPVRFGTQGERRDAKREEEELIARMLEQVRAAFVADQGDLRDIIASRAMAALVRIGTTPQKIADEAYALADAMMGARKPKVETEPEPERVLTRTQRELARERRVVANYIRGMTALSAQEAEDHASFIEGGHHRAGIEVLACQDQEPEAKS